MRWCRGITFVLLTESRFRTRMVTGSNPVRCSFFLRSALDCSTISEMFHGRDQLPLGPHANLVLVHRLVDDRERHKRGQFEILEGDADLGGALADHADVRRCGDDFVDTERALFATVVGEIKRQPSDLRQLVSVKLREFEAKSGTMSQGNQTSHPELREIRQLAHRGRQPFELIVVNLEHTWVR
jgi:hypothetical protein